MVKSVTWKLLLNMAAVKDLDIEQMDVNTAFLYSELQEEVYMVQPEGFNDGSERVYRLKRALYGLK